MPLEPEAPRRLLERRLDPREALHAESLAGHLMGDVTPGAQGSAAAHIQAMDPRLRLQQAAEALHGRADEPAVLGQAPPPEGVRGKRARAP